jgi:hypothetical protein
MAFDPEIISQILRKTPLPFIADDVLLEYIRFKNMGLIGKDSPMEYDQPYQDEPINKVAYQLGHKLASEPGGPGIMKDLVGPQRSLWERMIIGQLMGQLPSHVLGKLIYPDDPQQQDNLVGTGSALGALGAIAYPSIMSRFGKGHVPRPIGF